LNLDKLPSGDNETRAIELFGNHNQGKGTQEIF